MRQSASCPSAGEGDSKRPASTATRYRGVCAGPVRRAVGIMLAEHLGLAYSAVVVGIEPQGDEATIRVELEGGIDEVSRISLPAVLSIQTGINEPRYVSIMGIRKAAKKELNVIDLGELALSDDDLLKRTTVEEIFLPPETEGAEMLEGDASTIAEKILRIIKEKGVSI